MKRPLAMVMLLLLGFAAWRTGFHVPQSVTAQQPGNDPLGGPPAAAEPPAADPLRPTGNVLNLRFGETHQPSGDSARGAQPRKPEMTMPQWQRSYSQAFQLELTELADDGRSFNKVPAAGTAKVTPASLMELPKVSVTTSRYGGMDEGDMYGGGMSGYGGEAGFGGGYDDMGMMEPGGQILVDAQRREIEQRITWQAQADWVRQTFRSDVALSEEQRQELKKLFGEVLKRQYADQLRRQEIELQVVERRLANLRDQLARRAGAADRVVEFELQRLDLEAGGLGLGPDAQLQPAGRPGGSGMGGGYGGAGGYDAGFSDDGYDP